MGRVKKHKHSGSVGPRFWDVFAENMAASLKSADPRTSVGQAPGVMEKGTNQHVAIFNVEVEEEEESDEEAEEGDGGALPQTPHLVQGFPQQPHAARSLSGICDGGT